MVSSSPKIPGSLGTPDQLLGLKRLSEVEGKWIIHNIWDYKCLILANWYIVPPCRISKAIDCAQGTKGNPSTLHCSEFVFFFCLNKKGIDADLTILFSCNF